MFRWLLSATAAAALACGPSESPVSAQLEAEWRGYDRGQFRGAADAVLCAETGIVELLAARGDSGIGLAFYLPPGAPLASGGYAIFHGNTLQEPRPGANAALRWFTGADIVVYESVLGELTLETDSAMVSGTFSIRMQRLEGADTVRLIGSLHRVPVTRADSSCRGTSRRHLL